LAAGIATKNEEAAKKKRGREDIQAAIVKATFSTKLKRGDFDKVK
jgi:hypothetical protein